MKLEILIVDDDEQHREIVRVRLEAAGYRVSEAADGQAGLAAAKKEKPSLILLDAMMPKMDGWQTCRALREDPATKGIPVVMLTARSQSVDELRGWESGVDGFLTKPCEAKKLLEAVSRCVAAGGEGAHPSDGSKRDRSGES